MTTDHRIHVALAADENYVRPLAAAARSVVDNLASDRTLTIHVVDVGITPESKQRLRASLTGPMVTVELIEDVGDAVRGLPTYGFFSTAAYGRLLLPRLLPDEIERIVYLDCDTITRRCISELHDLPFDDDALALGVPDMGAPFVSCPWGLALWFETGRRADELNINTGVLAINLRRWREEDVSEQALEYVRSDRHQYNLDQEAINAVAGHRITAIDPHWNVQGELYDPHCELALPYTRDLRQAIRTDPWIIHYSNVDKPWHHGSTHPHVSEWFDSIDRTDWCGWRPPAPPLPVRCLHRAERLGKSLAKRLS